MGNEKDQQPLNHPFRLDLVKILKPMFHFDANELNPENMLTHLVTSFLHDNKELAEYLVNEVT
jgi:hypothetical protein